jgi:hypothetical protein
MDESEVYDPLDAARHLGSYLVDEYRGIANGNQPTVILPMRCFIRLGGNKLSQELICLVMDYVRSQLGESKILKLHTEVKVMESFVLITANLVKGSLRESVGSENLDSAIRKCHICMLWKPMSVFKNCGRCKALGYCSVDCQRRDWSLHQQSCQQ